jgi:zinc transport system ATP-binding protein
MTMIKAEDLYFSYTGTSPYILGGINLQIGVGEYVSVVGENGSGKSTLVKLILRLLKPTSGSISTAAKKIGYVPQRHDFSYEGFPITVSELLDSYRRLMKIKDKGVIRRSLEQVGLTDYTDTLLGTLSGGQSQKALIARSLIGNPELLILDEPSTASTWGARRKFTVSSKRLNRENGITVLSVEHNLTAAITNSTLIYHLSGGRGHICTTAKYAAEYMGSISLSERMTEMFRYAFMQNAFIVSAFIAILCPSIGIFLVLRRYSMIGDTLSHASLAGIALGLTLDKNPVRVRLSLPPPAARSLSFCAVILKRIRI